MTLFCIDVSRWQGPSIDFHAVARAGDALVFMKATDGVGFRDPLFDSNRIKARAAGLTCGFYHFAEGGDPIAEAIAFCAAVGVLQPGDMVALDWETTGANPPGWCRAWLDYVQAHLGIKPGLYLNQSERDGFNWTPVVQGDYWLWLAAYDGTPNTPASGLWPMVTIKQYTSTGHVPGVPGNVDQDVFYGDAAALARYGYQENDMVPSDLLKTQILAADGKSLYTVQDMIVQTNDKAWKAWAAAQDADTKVSAVLSAVQKLSAPVVDVNALAAALASNTTFVAAIAKAVNDDDARRMQS